MKNFFTAVLLFCVFFVQAQIVNIPDTAFKAKLLEASPSNNIAQINNVSVKIDTNNDGEIQNSEAEIINYLDVSNAGISSVTGLEAFTSLYYLNVGQNNLISIDISTLTFLTDLWAADNQLAEIIGLDTATQLWGLYCDNNQLTSINAYNLLSLYSLSCMNNHIQQIILPNKPVAPNIEASYNELTQIDFSYVNQLGILILDHNQLSSIDFNGPTLYQLDEQAIIDFSNNPLIHINIEALRAPTFADEIDIYNTLITELTLPNVEFVNHFIVNNPNLEFLSVKEVENLSLQDGNDIGIFSLAGNPNLRYVCIDDSKSYSFIQNELSYNQNIVYGSYCSFTPGGNYRTVTGNVRYDLNTDGCSVADAPAIQLPIKIVQTAQNLGTTYTNQNGNYVAYIPSGNLTLTPQLENSNYTVSPASFTSTFTTTNQTQTANFCITPNGTHNDLEVAIIPIRPARPGFTAKYKIIFSNPGTTTQSGAVTFYYSSDRLHFVSANPSATTNSPGVLTWSFTDLQPIEQREIIVTLLVNSPVQTPAVNVGDILTMTASVSPSVNDETYWNNNNSLEQVVVGSFDPNDKTVSALNAPYELADTTDILYTIRFQNMGTAEAENVVISDVLYDKLNDESFRMISSSHPCQVRYTKSTRKLECIFDGIQLPAAIADEPASHGYVTFKVKFKNTGIVAGDVLENKADIFFDFNAPVATNTTQTHFYSLLANAHFTANELYEMYPNPVGNLLTIQAAHEANISSIEVFNVLGQKVKSMQNQTLQKITAIDCSDLVSGTYLVKVSSQDKTATQKIFKQ